MNLSCCQLLAGAGFAMNKNRCLAACQFGNAFIQGVDGLRLADNGGFTRGGLITNGRAEFERRLHQPAQYSEIHRLGNKVESAGLERTDRGFHIAIGGNHRHRNMWELTLYMLHQINAITIGQVHIGEAKVEFIFLQQLPGILQVVGREGVDIHPVKGDFSQLADIRFVVDYQGSNRWHSLSL